MKIKLIFIKLIIMFLEFFGKGGSLPGKTALLLDKNILDKFIYPPNVIIITGTNGKTTISNLLFESLKKAGIRVISNSKGNNLETGIATVLCKHSDLKGNIKADVIVLEVDELTVPRVFYKLKTSIFSISNLFRDQLDRVGEMDNIVKNFENIVKDFNGHLILNADDPNLMRIKDSAKFSKNECFGAYKFKEASTSSSEAMEGRFCPRCNSRLSYDYYNYSHIGRFYCDNDGFGKNNIDVFCESVNEANSQMIVNGKPISLYKNSPYTIYNCLTALTILEVLDVNWDYASDVFKNLELNNGRNEKFLKGNKMAILNLIKNPVGTNEVLKEIAKDENSKSILILVNDNVQDGIDVSWIWDSNFELIFKKSLKIVCSGSRGYDVASMLKYKGYKGELIVDLDIESAITKIDIEKECGYFLSNYSGLKKMRSLIERRI